MTQAKVVCGSCKLEPEIVAFGNGDRQLFCPRCEQRDEADIALRIASEHARHAAEIALRRSGTLAEIAGKPATRGAKRVPRKSFRWHLAT